MGAALLPAQKSSATTKQFNLEEFVCSAMEGMTEEQMDAVAIERERILSEARQQANERA